MPEAERLEIFVLVDIDAVLDRISGDLGGLQLHREIVRVVNTRERSDELIDCRGILDARGRGRKARLGIGVEYREHRAPLLVSRDGDRYPSLVAVLIGASIGTVRSVPRGRVATRLKHAAGGVIVDQ